MFSIHDRLAKEVKKIDVKKPKDEIAKSEEFKEDKSRKIVAYCFLTKQVIFLQRNRDEIGQPYSTLYIHHSSFIDPVILCDFP